MKTTLVLKARQGLVQKKVQVTRGGKTYTTTVWVRTKSTPKRAELEKKYDAKWEAVLTKINKRLDKKYDAKPGAWSEKETDKHHKEYLKVTSKAWDKLTQEKEEEIKKKKWKM